MVLEELLIRIKTVENLGGFDKFSSKLRSTEAATKSSSNNMKNNLNQINNVRFDGLANKFKSTMAAMATTAKSTASSISNSLQSSVQSTEGALMGIVGTLGTTELFNKAMDKVLTKTQLYNIKKGEAPIVMGQYQQFTQKSSASDDDISKMLRFTFQGKSTQTYQSLNALDAASYSADPIQRKEGIRGWGTYLSGGWDAAAGMMKDEPLTDTQKKYLMSAETYDQKLAALERLAGEKGNLAGKDSLSTTTTGELGKYNKALASADAIMRGATSTFNTFMAAIEPGITWFNNLNQGTKDVIGGFLTVAAIGLTLATALGILLTVLSPVAGGLGKIASKLGEWTGIKKPDWLSKDKTINAVNVTVNGKTVTGSGAGGGTSPGGGTGQGGIFGGLSTIGKAGVILNGIGIPLLAALGAGNAFAGGGSTSWGLKPDWTFGSFQSKKASDFTWTPGGKKVEGSKKPLISDKMIWDAIPTIPKFKWPTTNQVFDYIKKSIPKIAKLVWPTSGAVMDFITNIFPNIPKLQWPTMGSISSWIQSAINRATSNKLSASVGASASAGGDAQSMLEDASLSNNGPTVNLYVGSIPNKAVADYTLDIIAGGLSGVNDAKGR